MTALSSNPSPSATREPLEIRLLEPSEPSFEDAVALALGVERRSPDLQAFHADTQRRGLEVAVVAGAFENLALLEAAMLLRSPGNSALVFFSCTNTRRTGEIFQLLSVLRKISEERHICLLEILLEPNAAIKSQAAADAGFNRLTKLEYLRRPAEVRAPDRNIAQMQTWVPFSENSQPLFADTIRRTYAQSQDCQELTSIRPMDDVLADHRAAGKFDPTFWQVAMLGDNPVGVLLLSRIQNQPEMEVVYMGVTPESRGRGIGDALIARAIELATTSGRVGTSASPLALVLAVDERNMPAKGLYARWGFTFIGARDAWVATSAGTRG